MSQKFFSKFGIGEDVVFEKTYTKSDKKKGVSLDAGTITAVRFTKTSTFYDVLDHDDGTAWRNIKEQFISGVPVNIEKV